jgi:type IV pilus assembly protein PilB
LAVVPNAVPKRIGELLVEAKLITQEQLDEVLMLQRSGDGRKIGQLLIDSKLVTEMQLTQTLSRQLAVPWVSLYHIDFSRSLLNLVTKDTAEKYSLVPIFVRKVRKQGETLYVAMDDPTNEAALAEVSKTAGIPARPMIACPTDIRSAIRVYYLGLPAEPPPAPASQAQAVPDKPAEKPPEKTARQDTKPDIPMARPKMPSDDSPDSAPDIEATELEIEPKSRRNRQPKMVALTLLDGTTLTLPSVKKSPSRPDAAESEGTNDQLTARDLVSALRAVVHGADASEILGEKPPRWEAMVAALLSLLLKKGIIADWEFVEEFRKI